MPKLKIAFVDFRHSYSAGFGAGYVASAVKNAGYDITFFDTYWMHPSTIVKRIVNSDYDVIMLSSMTMLFPKAMDLLAAVKEKKIRHKVFSRGSACHNDGR